MKTKHMLMACILTAAVTSPSARANFLTSLFKNAENVSQEAAYGVYKTLKNSDDAELIKQINKKWVQQNPEEARYLAKKVKDPEWTPNSDVNTQRSERQIIQDGQLANWAAKNPNRMEALDKLLKDNPAYAQYIAELSAEWDATNKYLQAIIKNPKTAIAATGAAAGIAGGSGLTYAIMKPEKGTTVTTQKKYN